MFKRFLVMDLFDSPAKQDGEWVSVEKEIPDVKSGIYFVKYGESNTCQAYFCLDQIDHLARPIGINPSHWWDKKTKCPIYNVTYWMK